MTTTYLLKPGARIRAEDLLIVEEDASPPPATKKVPTAQGKLDLQQKPPKPWANAHPRLKQTFNLRMSDELHLKLKHCAEIVPGAKSMQNIAIKAMEAGVAELLAKYDKD